MPIIHADNRISSSRTHRHFRPVRRRRRSLVGAAHTTKSNAKAAAFALDLVVNRQIYSEYLQK